MATVSGVLAASRIVMLGVLANTNSVIQIPASPVKGQPKGQLTAVPDGWAGDDVATSADEPAGYPIMIAHPMVQQVVEDYLTIIDAPASASCTTYSRPDV